MKCAKNAYYKKIQLRGYCSSDLERSILEIDRLQKVLKFDTYDQNLTLTIFF